MKTFRITRWTTSAAHPNETGVSLDILDTLPSGLVQRAAYDLMVPGRFDTASPELDAAVLTTLVVSNLLPPVYDDPLEAAKAAKINSINEWRLAANRTRFYFNGHAIQADQLSRGDIDGVNGIVTLTQAMPPGWNGAWKTEANEWVSIPDLATWGAFYGAMVAQGQANFAHAQELKTAVGAATSIAEVAAITWSPATAPEPNQA